MTDAAAANPPDWPALALRRAGMGCVLVAVCSRVVTTSDPLPGWSLDPLSSIAPENGMGPALSVALAALSLVGLALVLAGASRARERVPGVLLLLGALGLIPVAYHGWLGPTACVENANTGLTWAGAIAGSLAACVACRHSTERALVVACCAGLAGPLAVRAGIQVYSEHPVLVAEFESNREAFLASHGWTADSAMGQGFARRLSQPDASAWFAMSNVYASVMAGCVAVFAGACLGAVRARLWATGNRNDVYLTVGVFAGLACALGGLFIALPAGGSLPKGGAAAALLGLGLVGLGVWGPRAMTRALGSRGGGTGVPARLPGLLRLLRPAILGPAVVVVALLAVLIRGMLGERLGELSLLFRWFYLQAAVRIALDHPLWGVGPDGFQSAYLLAKNPLSPEEVSSPHSVLFEYASTLGAFALAWCGLLVALAARAGRSLFPRPVAEATPRERAEPLPHRRFFAVIVLCCLISFLCEALPIARAVPDAFALVLVDGLTKLLSWSLVWLGLGAALLALGVTPLLRVGLGAGALAVLAHSQIELTATDPAGSGWALLVLGAAAASTDWARVAGAGRVSLVCRPCTAALAGFVAVGALSAAVPIRAWQAELRETAARAAESTAFMRRADALGSDLADSPEALGSALAGALNRPIPSTPQALREALLELRLARVTEAAVRLDALARNGATPSRAVTHTAVRVRGAEVALCAQLGIDAGRALSRAIDLATWATARWPSDSRAFRDLAQVLGQAGPAAPTTDEAGPPADLRPLLRAAKLDPLSPHLALEISERFARADRAADSRLWAGRALSNHDLRRLDPLAGLSDSQVRRLRELLGVP